MKALLFPLALMTTAPVAAATYSAVPETPVQGRIIARDVAWTCGGSSCAATTENSRPVILCQALAKRTGRIAAFSVDGRAVEGTTLERCNSVASDPPALAARR